MEFPQPKLVRQTNERRPPDLSPAAAAVISAEQWAFHHAHVKRIEEAKARKLEEEEAKARKLEEKTQGCWLIRATAEMDAESVAILRKGYADMFECEEPQWKVNMDKHIAKARELERSKDEDAQDDTEKYFRSSFDSFETEHND